MLCHTLAKAIKKGLVNHTLLYGTPVNTMAKEKLSNDKKRELALDLYLNTDKEQKEICDIIGWTEKTFSANKAKYNWDELKGASTITAQNIIRKIYIKLEKMVDDEDFNPDKLIKTAKSIEIMSDRKVTISQHINCAKEITSWVLAKKPNMIEFIKQLNSLHYEFINEKVSNA